MENITEFIRNWLSDYGLNVVYALAIFFIGKYIAKMISRIIIKALNRASVGETLTKFLKGLIYYILLTAVIIASLNQLGIQTTSIVAVLATAGLAIGLALKDSLSNFAKRCDDNNLQTLCNRKLCGSWRDNGNRGGDRNLYR